MRNVYIVYFTHNGQEGFEVASSKKCAEHLMKIYESLEFTNVWMHAKTLVTEEML